MKISIINKIFEKKNRMYLLRWEKYLTPIDEKNIYQDSRLENLGAGLIETISLRDSSWNPRNE